MNFAIQTVSDELDSKNLKEIDINAELEKGFQKKIKNLGCKISTYVTKDLGINKKQKLTQGCQNCYFLVLFSMLPIRFLWEHRKLIQPSLK